MNFAGFLATPLFTFYIESIKHKGTDKKCFLKIDLDNKIFKQIKFNLNLFCQKHVLSVPFKVFLKSIDGVKIE